MSSITSPFGDEPVPDDDVAEVVTTTTERERPSIDPRVLRSLLGGAAAVAVLGAGAAGFLWLGSTPSGDVADAALGGARSTPAVVGPVRATGVAFGARDVFAAPQGAGADSGTARTAVTTGGAATGTGAVAAPTGVPAPARTTAPAPGPAATTAPGTPSAPATTVPATPPAPPTTAPAVVPAPASSAPGWTTPVVRFLGASGASGATATFDVDGEQRTFATGQAVYPLGLVYAGTVQASSPAPSSSSASSSTTTAPPPQLGVFTSAGDSGTGWIVPPGTDLPDAVAGRTQGRVRVVGVLRDRYFVGVDRQPDVLLAAGTAVAGTPLTFTGESNDVHARWALQNGAPAKAQGNVYFTDGAVVAFGRFGGGEVDGVPY